MEGMTVEELKNEIAEISDEETLEAVISHEKENKNRKTAKVAVANRLQELREADESEDSSSEADEQEEADQDSEEDEFTPEVLGWEEAPHQIETRLAFMQELLDRTDADRSVTFGAAPDGGIWEEDGELVFTETSLRTGQQRDHKTQWMHLLINELRSRGEEIPEAAALELLGDVEYEGLSSTLDHQRSD